MPEREAFAPLASGEPSSIEGAAARSGPVLLVEDEEVLRDALADALRRRGYETIGVGSAEDAAERLTGGLRPGLVFLDLNLPGASGWDLLRGELAPSADRPPVVLLTAITVDPARLEQFAVDGYLPKPFALATFLATARRFLTGASGVAS